MSEQTSINIDVKLKAGTEIFTKQVREAKGGIDGLTLAFKDLYEITKPGRGNKLSDEMKAAQQPIKEMIALLKQLKKEGKESINVDVGAKTRATIMGGAAQSVSAVKAAGPNAIAAANAKAVAAADREAAKALRDLNKAELEKEHRLRTAVFGDEELAKSAITMRYALYDVSSAATQVGQSMVNMTSAIVKAGIAQETSFTQVEKTLGSLNPKKVAQLKNELIDLSTQIPLSFDEITKIAMLGSQMGVSEAGLASFTDTVAEFSAVTGMSTDAAAEGFGKIASLLGLVTEEGKVNGDAMEALGSAIFAVGVESAATEEQIVSTTKQIAAVGTQAGLSAGQVIGLASSFASMGIAPEESRGVIVQLFNEISKASSSYNSVLKSGSSELATFTEVAQAGLRKMSKETANATLTQKDFARAWKDRSTNVIDWTDGISNAAEVFQAFASGLGNYDIPSTLTKINLEGVRTSKGLSTLAGGFDILAAQMELATAAGEDAGALNEAFGKKADDLASKIQILSNSFEALLASTSDSGFSTVIGALVEALTFLVNGFREFSKLGGGVGGVITTILLAAGALVGVIGLVVGVTTRAYGSFLAFKTSVSQAAISGEQFNGVVGRMVLSLAGVNREALLAAAGTSALSASEKALAVATNTSTVALKAQKIALITSGWGALIVLLGTIIAGFVESSDAATEAASGGLSDYQKGIKSSTEETKAAVTELESFMDAIASLYSRERELESSQYDLGKSAKAVGGDFGTSSQALRDYEAQVISTIGVATKVYGDDTQRLGEYLTQFKQFLITNGIDTINSLKIIDEQIKGLMSNGFNPAKAGAEQFNIGKTFFQGYKSSASSAGKAVDTLSQKIQKALKLMNAKSSMRDNMRDLGGSIEEVGKSFDSMNKSGSQNIGKLNSVIEGIVSSTGEKSQATANSLGALRKALWQAGVTSTFAYQMIDKAISATGKKAKVSSKTVANYFSLISSGMADAVKKNVKTIRDWADEVSGVVNDAFDIRFEKSQAVDALTTAWSDLSDEVKNANDSIKEINNTINGLTADRAILEYQLKIAKKYGDTLREAALKAKLDKNNEEMLKSQQELQAQLDATNKTLIGSDTVAVGNRAKILDLVKAYQEFLKTMAATTTDQGALSLAANGMREDFLRQAESLGFSRDQLTQYADAINVDFITAVKNIPTEITLDLANTDPIIAAIATFVSKANEELDKIKVVDINGNTIEVNANANAKETTPVSGSAPKTNVTAGGSSGGSGSGGGLPDNNPIKIGPKYAAQQKVVAAAQKKVNDAAKQIQSLRDEIAKLQASAAKLKAGSLEWSKIQYTLKGKQMEYGYKGQAITPLNAALNAANKKLSSMPRNLAFGGLVQGPGSNRSDSIPANLSNNEFVIQANAVKHYGADFMNALNNMKIPMAGSGAGQGTSGVIYLSPEDRALLRAAIDRPINLYTENAKIAASANAGNVALAQRGAH